MSLTAQNFAVAPALRGHVEALASEEMEGRRAGSDGERAAARYLYDALRDAGVLMLTDSLGQDFRISGEQGEIASQNIVGIVEGADPQLRAEYIVVGARYDHLGTHELTVDGEPVVQLYPGADANASGVAVLVDHVAMNLRRHGLKGAVVNVQIKTPELRSISRQTSLDHHTYLQHEIQEVALQLIRDNWPIGEKAPIRAITVGVTKLLP